MCRQLQVLIGTERSGHFQTEARYCRAGSATRAISCVNPEDSPLQRINTFVAFVDLVSDLPKREAGQLRHFSVVEAGDELLDLAAPLRRDDTEFGKMGA